MTRIKVYSTQKPAFPQTVEIYTVEDGAKSKSSLSAKFIISLSLLAFTFSIILKVISSFVYTNNGLSFNNIYINGNSIRKECKNTYGKMKLHKEINFYKYIIENKVNIIVKIFISIY